MGSGVEEGGLSRASLAQQQQKLSENPDSLHVHVEGESPTAAAKAVRSLDTRTFTEVGTPPDSREDNGLSDQTLEEAGHSGSSRHSNSPDSTSSHHVGHERKQQLQQQQTDLQDMRRGILNHLKHIGRDYAVGSDPSSREAKRMKALEATLRDVDILRKRVAQCLEEEEEVEEGTPLTSPHNATTATAGGGPPPPPPRGPKTQQTANDGLTTESSTSTTTTTTTTSSSSGNATPQQLSGTTPPTPTAADTAASPPAATPASPPVTMMKRPSVRPSSAAPRTEPTKSAEEDLSMKAYLASLMSASAVFVSHASNEKGGPMRPASAAPPSTTTTAAPSKAGGASQAPSRHNSRRPFSADYSNSAANSTGGSSGGSLDPSSDGIPSHLNVFLRKVPRPTHRRSDSADPSTEEGAEDVAPRPSLFARRSVPSSTASSAAEDSAAKPASPGVARPFSSLPRSTSFSSTGSSRRSSSASGAESDARHTTVQRLREKGNDFFQRQEYAKAVRVYSEGLRFDPLNDILCCNRAAANLLSFQFTAAVLDAKFVLLRSPNNLKANWRAAKGLLCTNRLPEARRYYRAARQICEEESSSPATTTNSSTVKWLKEKKAILAEEAAPDLVESYWSHMRQERWTEAYEAASQLISIFGGSGAASAPWRVKQLESLVFTDPNEAMTKVKALREEFPDFPDAMYLHAKALFYCAHDCDSTKLILELLNNVRQALESQNSQLEVNVRDFARHAQRTSSSPTASSGTNTSVEQIEGWLSTYRSTEDSRLVQLRRIVERFTHHRDEGNAAYGRSDWALAYGAYTRCLQVDPRNKSLLATTYCNRAAVCMQAGRWKDALCDVNDAIRYNTTNEKAFARRARIYLHMVEHGSGGGSSASSQEQKSRYLTAAVDDLKRAVSINSTTELKTQLNEAMERRKAFLNDQSGTSQPRAASASTSSFGRSSRNGSYGSFSGGKAPKYYTFDDDTGDSPARASPGRPSSTANDGGAASSSSGNPSTSSNSNGGGSSNANRAGSSSGGGGATYAGSSYARASSAGSHQSYRWGQQSYTYTGPGGGPYTSGYTNTNTNARSGGAYGSGSSSSSSYFRSSGTTPSSAAMKHMQSLGLAISACGPGGKLESRVLTKAYREAALRWHPDKWINGTQEQRQAAEKNFKDISVAYQVLKESHTF